MPRAAFVLLSLALLAAPSRGAPEGAPGAGPPEAAPAELAPPTWRRGDTWTLKVRQAPLVLGREARREAAAGRSEDGPPKGSLAARLRREERLTTYWTFKVAGVEDGPEGRLALVQAKDKDGAKDALSSLLFRSEAPREDAPRFFGLSEGKFLDAVGGQARVLRKVFWVPPDSARPVLPESSVIPHGFPVFPAHAGRTEVFPDTRSLGDMTFAFDTEQTLTLGVAAADVGGDSLVADLTRAGYPTEGLVLVEMARPFDGRRVRQLWSPGLPWAVWGEGPAGTYHLVYHFQREAP